MNDATYILVIVVLIDFGIVVGLVLSAIIPNKKTRFDRAEMKININPENQKSRQKGEEPGRCPNCESDETYVADRCNYVVCRQCHMTGPAGKSEEEAVELWNTLPHRVDEITELMAQLDFHPRAAKLMRKRKPFIAIANDEPYFEAAYSLIRDHEIEKGTWSREDQNLYLNLIGAWDRAGRG